MKVVKSAKAMRAFSQKFSKKKIGFVPTMGALHDGHRSLLKRARKQSDQVVLSIFVNPVQFNDPKDFAKYPSTLKQDLEMARQEGVDVVFLPQYSDIYPDEYRYKVTENQVSRDRCGASRPGHFDGVLTVVMRLFQLVAPHRAYFGEKDYQQLELIQGMVDSFFLRLKIIPVPTLRERDGLAMSSRNARLTPAQRQMAPLFPKWLNSGQSDQTIVKGLKESGFKVDYVTRSRGRIFGAVFCGDVRLIDNFKLDSEQKASRK